VCGTGRVDAGEQCDDGNQRNNDCCTTACVAQRRGTPCGSGASGECDAPDSCDSSGHCLENHTPSGTPCSDDGEVCTADVCDGAGICSHPPGNAGAVCRDKGALGACDAGDSCDGQNPDCPLGGAERGCFATVPDTVQGKKTISVTCEAQTDTVQGGKSRCIATGFQAARTPSSSTAPAHAKPAVTESECTSTPVTVTVRTALKNSAAGFRQRRLKLKLNAFGRKLLRQNGSLRVCVQVTIKHGSASSTTRYIVEIIK
jgi:cysteine-rich repeat protein